MSAPEIRCVALSGPAPKTTSGTSAGFARPLVVLGPALGTGVMALWGGVARLLAGEADVLGWELPGHGGTAAAAGDFTLSELAHGVLNAIDTALGAATPQKTESSFIYAGCSVGGAVGLQLLLDAPRRVSAAALVASGPRLGQAQAWHERARLVASAGTPTQIIGSAERWFAPGFIERDAADGAEVSTGLLHSLQDADRHGYAQVCEALAGFDVRDRLGEIDAPVIGIAGAVDPVVPAQGVRAWTEQVPGAGFHEIADAAHLVPAEKPRAVAQRIRALIHDSSTDPGGRP